MLLRLDSPLSIGAFKIGRNEINLYSVWRLSKKKKVMMKNRLLADTSIRYPAVQTLSCSLKRFARYLFRQTTKIVLLVTLLVLGIFIIIILIFFFQTSDPEYARNPPVMDVTVGNDLSESVESAKREWRTRPRGLSISFVQLNCLSDLCYSLEYIYIFI